MDIKFLDLKKQYLGIKDEIDAAIKGVIERSAFIGGAEVREFEREFCEYLESSTQDSKHSLCALGVANGSDALEIALEALELTKGGEVLIPANTFAATAEAVVRNGLKLVFVDCGNDYTMDLQDLERKITSQTQAIIPVQLYGQSADMDGILKLATKHNLPVIEDCAQAHGARFNGQCVGTFGRIATFSFYPGKNLGAYGDGGMIVSRDSELLQKCKKIANHGGLKKYEHAIVGRNSRLDGIQAAVLRVKLRHLESWNARRREIAEQYLRGLADCKEVILPVKKAQCLCVWHLFVVRVKRREYVMEMLKGKSIECGLHYPRALPCTQAYAKKP